MKKLLVGISISLALVGLVAIQTGCAQLQPGGAYSQPGQAPSAVFYQTDAAFALAYSAVDAAFQFERDNRALLWKTSPGIKKALDNLRPQAQDVVLRYKAARKAYLADPTPAGLSLLKTILSEADRISDAAIAALPKP